MMEAIDRMALADVPASGTGAQAPQSAAQRRQLPRPARLSQRFAGEVLAVLAHGLERLGILPMSAEEALRDENQCHRVLSNILPTDPDEVEQWMRQIWKRR